MKKINFRKNKHNKACLFYILFHYNIISRKDNLQKYSKHFIISPVITINIFIMEIMWNTLFIKN